jgi:hypothetical protein
MSPGDVFPLSSDDADRKPNQMPATWRNLIQLHETRVENYFPLRRLSFRSGPSGALDLATARTVFQLRDEVAVDQPEDSDSPGQMQWSVDPATNNVLAPLHNSNYSWLATLAPDSPAALEALQPSDPNHGAYSYEVSIVVFYKRDDLPSQTSERMIRAEVLGEGEIALYSTLPNVGDAADQLEDAFDDIRPGNWIGLTGVNQHNGAMLLKWYRILAMDDEPQNMQNPPTDIGVRGLNPAPATWGYYATVKGPTWPRGSQTDLRAMILPGVIHVTTTHMDLGHQHD